MGRRTVLLALLLVACHRTANAPADAGTAEAAPPDVPRIVITKDRQDLLFSYLDPSGGFHDVSKIDDVPEVSRAQVLVRDLSRSPDEMKVSDYLYIADLRTPDSSGHFTCGAVSRRGFETKGASEAAAQVATETGKETGQLVTVYSASWCGVCKQAKAFLKKKGIPFVDKDVEQDPKAGAELAAKAKAQGLRPQGVPVIDVSGELMMGFDPDGLSALLDKKGIGHTL
jgi:glutaredoxin